MKSIILLIIALAFGSRLNGATTLPITERYDWNFSLVRTANTTSNLGSVAIRLLASNKLEVNEFLKLRLFALNATVPFYSVNMTGFGVGSDNFASIIVNLVDYLPNLQGRVELTMFLRGTVDVGSIFINAGDGTNLYNAQTNVNVRLVPELSTPMMLTTTACLLCLRRRRKGIKLLHPA